MLENVIPTTVKSQQVFSLNSSLSEGNKKVKSVVTHNIFVQDNIQQLSLFSTHHRKA